jgi:hypothetical protein
MPIMIDGYGNATFLQREENKMELWISGHYTKEYKSGNVAWELHGIFDDKKKRLNLA